MAIDLSGLPDQGTATSAPAIDFSGLPDQGQPTAQVGPLEDVQGAPQDPAGPYATQISPMSPEDMSRTGQLGYEPSTVTAGTEPTAGSNALAAAGDLIQEQIPRTPYDYAKQVFPPLAAADQGAQLATGNFNSLPGVGSVQAIRQADETPAFSKERFEASMRTLMDLGMLAGAGEGHGAPIEDIKASLQTPDTVRLYHGGSGESAGNDFSLDQSYAQAYANKLEHSGQGKVWYVDAPVDMVQTHDENGLPLTRVRVPDDIANQARPLSPEAPVNAPESPVARSDAGNAPTEPKVESTGQAPEPQMAQVTVPTADDLRQAVSEGRFDDARDIALQMERAAKAPKPATVDVAPETPNLEPQNEPRPADQAVEQQPGQRPGISEQQPGLGGRGQSGAGAQVGQDTGGTGSFPGEGGEGGGVQAQQSTRVAQAEEGEPREGINNEAFDQAYGKGEVEPSTGKGAAAWRDVGDNRLANWIRNGDAADDPYAALSKARTRGAAPASDVALLAAEHRRLLNDAQIAQDSGAPDWQQKNQQAYDLAQGIQQVKGMPSDAFRAMQESSPKTFDNLADFDAQIRNQRGGEGLKPNEQALFKPMSEEIARGSNLSDAKLDSALDAAGKSIPKTAKKISLEDANKLIDDQISELTKPCKL